MSEISISSQPIDCQVLLTEAPLATSEGCPLITKRRHISIPKGVCGTAVWTVRLPSGLVANLTDCMESVSISSSGSIDEEDTAPAVLVRFGGCDRGPVLAEVEGEITDPATGSIQFEVPEIVCQHSGIYFFQVAVMKNGAPAFVDGGLISVEHGLWGDTNIMLGPPTIQEIRFALQDRAVENVLLQDVEFDDNEILEAIRWPVLQFNERPPTLDRRYNCNTFPFRYHWLNAIVARLLMMAAHHYVRNKMQVQSGGMVQDDKNKNDDYLRIAKMYLDEWNLFVSQKKVELNAEAGWGSMGGGY